MTITTPANGATGVALATTVTATFDQDLDPTTVTTATFEVRTPANALVPATVSYHAGSRTATLVPSSPLSSSTVYTATLRGGPTDPRIKNASGVALAGSVVWSFTTLTPAVNCPCSIWPASAVPATASFSDASAVEVGVKFQPDRNGYVTGIRFYKGSANTGIHVGSLWSAAGALLGSVTFANETASGWQQAIFSQPLAVTANTMYMASYYAPVGRYAVDNGYFAAVVDNPPLRALANATSPNGMFGYSAAATTFPTQSGNGANYWVDVVFTDVLDTTPPTVNSTTPANGTSGVPLATSITAAFSEDLNPSTVSGTTFELRSSDNTLVSGTVSYDAASRTAGLVPSAALAASTIYSATLRGGPSGVKDWGGNALASDVAWSFTTSLPPPAVTATAPASGATSVSLATAVTATFDRDLDPATVTAATFELRLPNSTVVPAVVSYNAGTRTATLVPSAPLSGSTVYSAALRGGSTDPRVKSAAGIALEANVGWSFTTTVPTVNCPCSIWNSLTVPATPSSGDASAVEVGLKFQPDRSGFITAIRFYKGGTNTGTHVGSLWTAGGALLGSVTFNGESGSGWQQATFGSPIAVTANTVYVASYYAPVGRYAADTGFFSAAIDNPPLRALATGTSPNGIYVYTTTPSVFPNQSGNGANYWVDVVFQTSVGPDTTPPAIVAQSPSSGATGVSVWAPATAAFNEPLESRDGLVDDRRAAHAGECARPGNGLVQRREPDRDASAMDCAGAIHDIHGDSSWRRHRSAHQGCRWQPARLQRGLVFHDDGRAGGPAKRWTGRPDSRDLQLAESLHAVLRRDPSQRRPECFHRQRHLAGDRNRVEQLRHDHPRRDGTDFGTSRPCSLPGLPEAATWSRCVRTSSSRACSA